MKTSEKIHLHVITVGDSGTGKSTPVEALLGQREAKRIKSSIG